MANEEHLAILERGVKAWNEWREANPSIWPDLKEADLRRRLLGGVDLMEADLVRADFTGATLLRANLRGANLREADLIGTDLRSANLRMARLIEAQLNVAHLERADLTDAHLEGANLTHAHLEGANPPQDKACVNHLERDKFRASESEGLFGLWECCVGCQPCRGATSSAGHHASR